jgi:hypothetical protein
MTIISLIQATPCKTCHISDVFIGAHPQQTNLRFGIKGKRGDLTRFPNKNS